MTLATTVSGILGRIAELKTFWKLSSRNENDSLQRYRGISGVMQRVWGMLWLRKRLQYKFGKIRWLMYRGSIELIGQSTSILRGLEKFACDLVGKSDRGLSRVVSQEFRTNVRGSRNNWFTRNSKRGALSAYFAATIVALTWTEYWFTVYFEACTQLFCCNV